MHYFHNPAKYSVREASSANFITHPDIFHQRFSSEFRQNCLSRGAG